MNEITCSLRGHRLVQTQEITEHFGLYCCTNCKKQFGVDAKGKLVPATQQLIETYESILKVRRHRESRHAMAS